MESAPRGTLRPGSEFIEEARAILAVERGRLATLLAGEHELSSSVVVPCPQP